MQCNLPILSLSDMFAELGRRYPHIAGDIFLRFTESQLACGQALSVAPYLPVKMRDIPSCIVEASRNYRAGRVDGKRIHVELYSFDENIDSSANVDDYEIYDDSDITDSIEIPDSAAMSVLKTIKSEFGDNSRHLTVAAYLAQGKTQTEISSLLGISQPAVYYIVRDIRDCFQ